MFRVIFVEEVFLIATAPMITPIVSSSSSSPFLSPLLHYFGGLVPTHAAVE